MQRLYPTPGTVADVAALETEYLVASPRHARANFVISLDGMVEVDGRSGPLGGEADRAAFMAMRAVSDVVLVGAGTVRAESTARFAWTPTPRRGGVPASRSHSHGLRL